MPEVYNWHLGRKMLYPYEERHPKWQFAFVFNINRCLACQTCSMADKSTWLFSEGQEYMWWNNVETKQYARRVSPVLRREDHPAHRAGEPGRAGVERAGRPQAPCAVRGVRRDDHFRRGRQGGPGGDQRSTDQEASSTSIYEDTATSMRALVENIDKSGFTRDEPWRLSGISLPEHETYFFYLQRICNHCTYPGCLAACPHKAIYKRPEDGIVLIDQNRCRGYKKCVEQCPFKKPMYRGTTRVSEKCIACYPRIEGRPLTGGEPMETRCMAACVGKIRMQSLVRIGEDGLGRRPVASPVLHDPRGAGGLAAVPAMGDGARGALFRRGTHHELCATDVRPRRRQCDREVSRAEPRTVGGPPAPGRPASRSSSGTTSFRAKVFEPVHRKRFDMYNDTVLGFGKSGKEVARIQVEEPIYIWPAERVRRQRKSGQQGGGKAIDGLVPVVISAERSRLSCR
ncbi:MAG: 4Fe-4S dicluster domain-containing protein [Nitrospiraceae bacterium]